MAAKYSDWYFINGNSVEGAKEQIDEVRALARAEGRRPTSELQNRIEEMDRIGVRKKTPAGRPPRLHGPV